MTIEPKFYMIQMSANEISQYYKQLVLPSWEKYHVHMFEAITPETLYKYDELKFDIIKSHNSFDRKFTDTEKAVWFSHFSLWKFCVKAKKPIVIIEHDMKLVKELPMHDFRETNGIGLGMTYYDKLKRNVNLPCGCYYLTPYLADILIKTIKKNPVRINPDGFIKKFLDTDMKNWCAEQVIDKSIGTTIVHNK